MLSRFDFLLGTARSFGFLVGEALFFSKKINKIFSDKVKTFILVSIESVFIIAIRPYK